MQVLVVFLLDGRQYALPLSTVERAVLMVEVTPLPAAPDIVSGAINVQGRIIPVVDMRMRFGLPQREAVLADQLVVARTSKRSFALAVDAVLGVAEHAEQDVITAEAILPGIEYVRGVVKLRDGMILIHDLERLLSLEEEQALDCVLSSA